MKHLTKLVAAAALHRSRCPHVAAGEAPAGPAVALARLRTLRPSRPARSPTPAAGTTSPSTSPRITASTSAQTSLGIKINTAESSSDTDFAPNVEAMVSDGCNLIIGVGFNLEQAIHKSAEDNTDVHYALIDSSFSDGSKPVTLDNGRPLLFNTAEAAFLAGYAAAGMTQTGKVATFGRHADPLGDGLHGWIR